MVTIPIAHTYGSTTLDFERTQNGQGYVFTGGYDDRRDIADSMSIQDGIIITGADLLNPNYRQPRELPDIPADRKVVNQRQVNEVYLTGDNIAFATWILGSSQRDDDVRGSWQYAVYLDIIRHSTARGTEIGLNIHGIAIAGIAERYEATVRSHGASLYTQLAVDSSLEPIDLLLPDGSTDTGYGFVDFPTEQDGNLRINSRMPPSNSAVTSDVLEVALQNEAGMFQNFVSHSDLTGHYGLPRLIPTPPNNNRPYRIRRRVCYENGSCVYTETLEWNESLNAFVVVPDDDTVPNEPQPPPSGDFAVYDSVMSIIPEISTGRCV